VGSKTYTRHGRENISKEKEREVNEMCKLCDEAEAKFRENTARSGTEAEREGDIRERELLWRLWQEQKAKCNKKG
jgi:hypothetical protein